MKARNCIIIPRQHIKRTVRLCVVITKCRLYSIPYYSRVTFSDWRESRREINNGHS